MGRRKNKKKSHWSAYNPTDTSSDAPEGGAPGGPAFFHYHPGSSGINQSWWFNTFGKQQDSLLEGEEDPATSTSSENKNEVRNEFPLEPKSYDPKYREYRPPQRSPSPLPRSQHPRSRTVTPPLRQGPSLEYIATSDDPSRLLTDPTSSRKLLVLDLNGTLLHRSPHPSKNAPRYPIPGKEGFQPRLRSVHPRPYLPSFKSYIFHPSNKEWLDVMVWSSAQPHSVHGMVDKCFRDEKHHFAAIWARDTLGLPQHLYSRKVQTLKDLNIPWSKLFTPADPPGVESHLTSHHTAMSTLLMDDSPLKAELQPYNHLCVKEYSNVIRNRDLASLQEENRIRSLSPLPPAEGPDHSPLPLSPRLPLNIPHPLVSPTVHRRHPPPFNLPPPPLDPPSDFHFDQSVGIQPGATLLNPLPFTTNAGGYPRLSGDNGLGIAPQMLFKNPPPPMIGYQNPRPPQQLPQTSNPLHPHPPLTEAPAQTEPSASRDPSLSVETTIKEVTAPSVPLPYTPSSKKRKRKGKREVERGASRTEPVPEITYDETLLAVIGVLDEVRHQSNVASWVKANGLWGPHPPRSLANPNIDAAAQGLSGNNREDITTLSDSGSMDSGRRGNGKKKRRDIVPTSLEAGPMEGSEDVDSPHAPTNETRNQSSTPEVPLWFENPPTVRHWVDRGRSALATAGIPIEHGLKQ